MILNDSGDFSTTVFAKWYKECDGNLIFAHIYENDDPFSSYRHGNRKKIDNKIDFHIFKNIF